MTDALRRRYVLERELGRGGMATVYLVRDLKLDRLVALKVLHPEIAASLGTERFLREIRLTARLQHPHILPVFDSGMVAGQPWYTMPYVRGESLRHRLRRDVQLPIQTAVEITRQVALALEYAHHEGVVHRDIKPENVLLSEGQALVADFGVARAIDAAAEARVTGTGLAIGTPAYMAPEQASDDQVDGRTDIYALACLLYELLAGEPPLTGRTPQATIAKRLAGPAPSLRIVRPTVAPTMDQAIRKATAPVPADRFATAALFAQALEAPPEVRTATDKPPAADAAPAEGVRVIPLWSVLLLYALSSAAMLGLASFSTLQLGLPDWVVPGAMLLLAFGLPVVLTTAAVQGMHASRDRRTQPSSVQHRLLAWLNWRNALGGGVLAFASLAAAAAVYMALRALGIGPPGTLLAAGVLQGRERVLLADFQNRTGDSLLGDVATNALRIDLAQSPLVTLVPAERVAEVLKRMRRPATQTIDAGLAREIALREGIQAVVTGEVVSVGSQIVLSAQLVSPVTGEVLAAGRETARDSTQIMRAVDRVSKKLRERIGESLKSLRTELPLQDVTTRSLEALRKYSQAEHRRAEGDDVGAIALLEEAVALDTAFAMAYRALGTTFDRRREPSRAAEALTKAFRHRHRLTEKERYHTEGSYYWQMTSELEKARAAYSTLLEVYPDDRGALNNLGAIYLDLRQDARAEPLFRRLVALDSTNWGAAVNLLLTQLHLGRRGKAERMMARGLELFPQNPWIHFYASVLASSGGDYRAARAHLVTLQAQHGDTPFWRAQVGEMLAQLASARGRLAEAEQHERGAMAAALEGGDTVRYLRLSLQQATVQAEFRRAPAVGLERVRSALARFPLDSMKPDDRPYLTLAKTYVAAGEPRQARALLTEYDRTTDPLQRQRNAAERHSLLGELARAEGRLEDAVFEFHQQAARDICRICAYVSLGSTYDQARAPDSAIAAYEHYVATPYIGRIEQDAFELGGALKRLGELYEVRGELERALEYSSRFVTLWEDCDRELRPQVAEARRRVSSLRSRLGGSSGLSR